MIDEKIVYYKASDLITHKNISIVILYLLAKNILEGTNNQEIYSLYKRLYFLSSQALEPPDTKNKYASSTKNTIEDFIQQFKSLIESIQNNGF